MHSTLLITLGTAIIEATRADAPPRIDGRATEAVWQVAERRQEFRMFSPREEGDPTVRTELQIAYDDRALYVLVRAFDPRPDSIVRLIARRDTDGAPNDQIQLFIDSFHDRRSGYEYIVNAAGVKSDYLIFDDTGFDQSWDGVWDVATTIDSLGWVAEFAIPLQQLRFTNRDAPQFGIMVWRLVGRSGERVSWPSYRPSRSGYMSQTGTLTGLRDLARRSSLEASPYSLVRTRNAPPRATDRAHRTSMSVGGDVRFLPRPNVSIDATFNPDFGQVESDPAVLDLSGFEVFHAERRPFFLEGAGQFHVPLATDGSALLFHSRRIGRSPLLAATHGGDDAPTETTIHGAAKITARVSKSTSLVALLATTAEEEGAANAGGGRFVVEPRASFAVARAQHDFRAGRSGIGVMFTHVNRSRSDSLVASVIPTSANAVAVTSQHQTPDGNYRLSAWLGGSEVRGSRDAIATLQLSTVHGFQQPDSDVRFDSTRSTLRGGGGQVFVGKVAGGVTRLDASYRWISAGFDVNELGFMTLAGIQSVSANAGLRSTRSGRIASIPYRTASATLGFLGDWTSAGLSHARGVSVTGNMQLPNQMQLQATLSQQLAGAFCTTSCTRGGPALVDPARTRVAFDITGDPRRRAVPHATIEWYRDDAGRSHSGRAQLDALWRARSNFDVSLAITGAESVSDAFFYRRFGSALSDTALITVGRLDQAVRSMTARIDYTVTTALSVQWYGQAYVSRGQFMDIRALADPRADRYDDRFRPYADTATTNAPDGVDFRQFRSNAVVLWEYRPGSTLFLVWTQGRDIGSDESGTLRVGPDVRELFRQRPANQFALKASYWLRR